MYAVKGSVSTPVVTTPPNISVDPDSTGISPGKGEVVASTFNAYSGSITPTTQGKAPPIDLGQLAAELSRMSNANNAASSGLPLVNGNAPAHSPTLVKIPYQSSIAPSRNDPSASTNPTGPLVERFAIDPEAVKSAANQPINANELHPVEKEGLQQALQALSGQQSAAQPASGKYKQNTFMVDIFARMNGLIKQEQGKTLPETHTVVLWKKQDDEIVLFDPNKREFSQHIKEPLQDMLRQTHANGQVSLATFFPANAKMLYGTRDLHPANQRDCIDIAAKIGFTIEEDQLTSSDAGAIEKSAYLRITNQAESRGAKGVLTNKQFLQQVDNRALHSTDNSVRNDTNTQLNAEIDKARQQKTVEQKTK